MSWLRNRNEQLKLQVEEQAASSAQCESIGLELGKARASMIAAQSRCAASESEILDLKGKLSQCQSELKQTMDWHKLEVGHILL